MTKKPGLAPFNRKKIWALENEELRRIFEPKGQEIMKCRQLQN
jgi:hypothetical protein